MSHADHKLPRRVLGDDCEECINRAQSIEGLSRLDNDNLRKLAVLAAEIKARAGKLLFEPLEDASYADMRAAANLCLAARIVFASGITEEVAR